MKRIGIICAGDKELAPFLPHIENLHISENAMLKFYEGQINDAQVVALYSGVCKVNAAIAAQILIDKYFVDAIVNAGTAGGMDESLELFDVVISTQVAYHDVDDGILTDFHPWLPSIYFNADKTMLEIAKEIYNNDTSIHFGRMVTGEEFIQDHKRKAINEKHSPLSVDMETGSIAHVCYANSVPFIAIRAISDTAIHSGTQNFEKNCTRAAIHAKDVTLSFLKAYNGFSL